MLCADYAPTQAARQSSGGIHDKEKTVSHFHQEDDMSNMWFSMWPASRASRRIIYQFRLYSTPAKAPFLRSNAPPLTIRVVE